MGRTTRILGLTLSAGIVVLAACRDTSVTSPTGATAITDWRAASVGAAAACTPMTLAQLNALTDSVFAGGGPNANSVKSKIDQIDKAKKKGDAAKANDAAFNANRFVFQKFKGPQPLAGTSAQVARLISGIFCFAGINITISDPANSNIIDPASTTQIVKSKDSTAGTRLPPGSITEPTVLEFTKVPSASYSTPGAGPLNTRLDQYPGFYLIQAGNASGSGPAVPVIVAICPDASVPASIRGRLRLGHEKSNGFEIAPPADASFLNCPAPTNLSFLPGWASKALSTLMPRTLYAAIGGKSEAFVGGVGGTASEFSPFDPVDPVLEFAARGGVGGTAGEFTTRPTRKTGLTPEVSTAPTGDLAAVIATPGATANTLSAGACSAVEAPWSAELEPQCRPRLELKTRLGTPLRNVPLTWSVTAGDGTIAAGVPGTTTCTGAFAASVTFNTSADSGKAGVCWKMGPTLGTNTVTVTPGIGGDVPPGVTYVPAIPTFNATAIKATPTVNISCPTSVVYNGADQTPCTASVTDSIHGALSLGAVPVVYGPTTPPRNAGTYTADASYAEAALYFGATAAQKSFEITKAAPTVVVSCPASVPHTGSAIEPCTATVTGPGALTEPVAVTYADNVVPGTATATASYPGAANHLAGTGSATFVINPPPPSNFFDGFETPSLWASTGLWNRSAGLSAIVNAAFPNHVSAPPGESPGGRLPAPLTGALATWFGGVGTGNYIGVQVAGDPNGSGGTSASPVSGTLTSPNIAISPSLLTTPVLSLDTWWEIESVDPHAFDLMKVSVYDVVANTTTQLGVLNPTYDPNGSAMTPFTSGGFNAPPVWTDLTVDLSAFRGRTVRLVFSFGTGDTQYNGYRGWVIDNVLITNATSAIRLSPSGGRSSRTLNPTPAPAVRSPQQP